VVRVNPIRQFSSLGEETPLFGERVDEASRGSMYTLSGFRVPEFTQTELRQLEVVHVDVYNTPPTKAALPSPSVGASTRTHSTLLTLSSSLRVKGLTRGWYGWWTKAYKLAPALLY
jgi:hypothetical protein